MILLHLSPLPEVFLGAPDQPVWIISSDFGVLRLVGVQGVTVTGTGHTPQGHSSAPELLPLLRMLFPSFHKSQLLLFHRVFVHFWSSLTKGQNLGFLPLRESFCSALAHRCSTLQVPGEKDNICRPKSIPTLLSPFSTLSICMWTALLLEGELRNSGDHLLREVHMAKEP